jgi:hypothetical protein
MLTLPVWDVWVIGALLPSSPKNVCFVLYVHGCTFRECKCVEDGWLYLEQVMEASHWLPKGTETPTKIHNPSITAIFSTNRYGCPSTAPSSFGSSYTSAPSFQPASQCCISISQLSFLLHFFIPHTPSFCIRKPVLLPTLNLHFFHHSAFFFTPLIWLNSHLYDSVVPTSQCFISFVSSHSSFISSSFLLSFCLHQFYFISLYLLPPTVLFHFLCF